jgi:hypothetical protein
MSQRPDGAAVRVVGSDLVEPAPLVWRREPVVKATVGTLCALQEVAANHFKLLNFWSPGRRAQHHDQCSSDIIGAIPAVEAGRGTDSMLQHPDLVAEA